MAIKFLNNVAVDSDVLYVDTVNNEVGIGTTNPLTKLQVGDGTADDAVRSYFNDGSYTEMRGYGLQFSRAASYIRPTADNTKTLYLGSNVAQWNTLSIDASTTTFNTNGSEHMRIDSAGNVGIGTSSPDSTTMLSIESPVRAGFGLFCKTFGINNWSGFYHDTSSIFSMVLRNGSGTQTVRVSSSGDTYFNGGDVGIGTSSPDELLHIKGSTANTAMEIESSIGGSTILKFNNDGGGSGSSGGASHIYFGSYNTSPIPDIPDRGRISYYHNTQTLGGDYMSFTTSSIERVRIQSGGNVGINTTNPTEKLTVSGNAYITNNLYVGSGNTLKSCTYSATNGLMVGVNNSLGGVANGIIGVGNTIDCTAAPWDLFGGNFIAGKNNTINNQYTHANAVFGQNNTLGNSGNISNNVANSLIAGSEHTLFSNNALVYGFSCFASSSQHSLTGGYDSNNFASYGSIAIGSGATASAGLGQFALGTGITTPTTVSAAYGPDQFVVGKFNEYTNASSVPHRFAVGNGVSDASRSTPFCVVGGGTYTNGQVSINDADGFAYTTVPYSVFHVNGRATSSYSSTFTVTSDERLKDNILDYDKGLAEILQVKPKSYTFNGKANTVEGVESIGVLAQEIKDVFPETIGTVNKRLNPTDEEETELYTVDISPVTYALINAIKELNAKIEALENRIQILEGN